MQVKIGLSSQEIWDTKSDHLFSLHCLLCDQKYHDKGKMMMDSMHGTQENINILSEKNEEKQNTSFLFLYKTIIHFLLAIKSWPSPCL